MYFLKINTCKLEAKRSSDPHQIKSRRMRWAGHVARMGEERKVYKFKSHLLLTLSGKRILKKLLSEKMTRAVKSGRALLSAARSAEDEDWPADAVSCNLATKGSCCSNDKCLTPHYPLLGLHGALQGFIRSPFQTSTQSTSGVKLPV
jgi:hypothetical protein